MSDSPERDKTGKELNAQRFQMLEDIAKELAGEVLFPTCFDTAERIRKLLDDPEVSLDRVAAVVMLDPLVSSKLINLANSAAYGGSGQASRDVKNAISRLGLKMVRTTSMAIAMKQMLMSRGMVEFDDLTRKLWEHSLHSAAAAYVLARRLTKINPDEAQLAGLVHDLGAFYMLYRALQYPELRMRPETVYYLIIQWHDSIGLTLLASLGLPEDIVDSTRDHDHPRPMPQVPKSLGDIVYIANIMAGAHFEWVHQGVDVENQPEFALNDQYLALREEIQERTEEMRAAFA